jgi:transposase
MSLHPRRELQVPAETARVARASFPKGNVYMKMRDELGVMYQDGAFAALFSGRGQPAEAPGYLALVTVMQYAEGLTDRQAADAVRSRIDWKYALDLELTDAGFDYSVLSEYRSRVIAGGAEQQLLDLLLVRFKERGWLKARGRQRTDSTHVLAAVRALNRLELVGETLRAALNSLAVVAPAWLRGQIAADWHARYDDRLEETRLPASQAERAALALTIGRDGYGLLKAIYRPDAPGWLREVPAVQILRRVWLQQYYIEDDQIQWREAGNLPSAPFMLESPYDVEAHYSEKRETTWKGYKLHVTETCDVDRPNLIVHVATTLAPVPDVAMLEPIHAALAAKDLLPSEHLVDAGYPDAHALVSSGAQGIDVVGPVRADTSWQKRMDQGFDVRYFNVDWSAHTVTCPQGKPSTSWSPSQGANGNAIINIRFAAQDCRSCPVRNQCTQAQTGPRTLKIAPQAEHVALVAARERQTTDEFKQRYRTRAGVEGTLSQGTRTFGLRQTRYIGLAKTHLQHIAAAAAIDLVRIMAWLGDKPKATTRRSHFAALPT